MIAKETLFLDVTRRRIVKYGDPAAAFLLVSRGGEVENRYQRFVSEFYNETKHEQKPDEPLQRTRRRNKKSD